MNDHDTQQDFLLPSRGENYSLSNLAEWRSIIKSVFSEDKELAGFIPSLDQFDPNNFTGNDVLLDNFAKGMFTYVAELRKCVRTKNLPEDFRMAYERSLYAHEELAQLCANHPTYDSTFGSVVWGFIDGFLGISSDSADIKQTEMKVDWGNRFQRKFEECVKLAHEIDLMAMKYDVDVPE